MTAHETWSAEHSIETTASPQAIWSIFRDVAAWTSWNDGVERVEIEGPFAVGTWFTMKPTGQDAVPSRLVEVRENELFVDETRMDDLLVTVAHRIQGLGSRGSCVAYAIDVAGPGASQIGPAIASDFPEVLASLAARAEGRES